VKGMFVHPSQVDKVVKRWPEILRARLTVSHDAERNDVMTLQCEVAEPASDSFAQAIEEALREATKLRGHVVLKPRGALPNDGKVIEDVRKYD